MKYRVIVKPKFVPENLILDGLYSNNIPTLMIEVSEYMKELEIDSYEIISINKIVNFSVIFDDIILN